MLTNQARALGAASLIVAVALSAHAQPPSPLPIIIEVGGQFRQIDQLRQGLHDLRGTAEVSLASCTRYASALEEALTQDTEILHRAAAPPAADGAIARIRLVYQHKIQFYDELTNRCSSILLKPRPDAAFARLARQFPTLAARQDDLDRDLLQPTTELASLVDTSAPGPDEESTASGCNLAVAQITDVFSTRLTNDHPDGLTASAAVIRDALRSSSSCSAKNTHR